MARITRKSIELRFARCADAMGWATGNRDIGSVHLDYAPIYGGWAIVQIVSEGGGERSVTPWGQRLSAMELTFFMAGCELGATHAKAREDA